MNRDVVTHFVRFAKLKQKKFHESFVTKNSIPWWNIDFDCSYIIQYSKQNQKEKFNILEHSKIIPYFEFFKCKCGTRPYLGDKEKRKFEPHLWHYDNRHKDGQCPFRRRCEYFKLLQSVDKSLPKKERLMNLNQRGSLMKIKKAFRDRKLDCEIFLWIKNFNDTGSTMYKNESKLLQEFKSNIFKRKKKQKMVKRKHIEEIYEDIAEREAIFTDEKISGNYNAENGNSDVRLVTPIRSPEYHPQSPSL